MHTSIEKAPEQVYLLRGEWVFLHFLNRRGWKVRHGRMSRSFRFGKRTDMLRFAGEAVHFTPGALSPRLKIAFGVDACRVSLKTHVAQGVSEQDLFLASRLDTMAQAYPTFRGAQTKI